MASPFEVLGIGPEADDAEVVHAYRERVKEVHPDHGGTPAEFRTVQTAYETIRESRDGGERTTVSEDTVETRWESSTVEYLNFDVLDDHGWQLDDENLFERASDEGLDPTDHGRFLADSDEFLLEAAENREFAWPYACRGGACANCAVAVVEGGVDMPPNHVLPSEMIDQGIRLSCVGTPTTEEMKVIYNIKHLPALDELLLPAHRFEQA